MKRFIVLFILFLGLAAHADTTTDNAVAVLKRYQTANLPKIQFMDLTTISLEYNKIQAMTANEDGSGDLYILISDKYKNSPPEAVACLIAHELVHCGNEANSLNQELEAHNKEAILWAKILKDKPSLKDNQDPLVIFLNKLETKYEQGTLRDSIIDNRYYKNLK